MIYEECKHCKNYYDDKHISDGCIRIFHEFEMDDDGFPRLINGECFAFKRKGLFSELPYKVKDKHLRNYIENNLNTFLEKYTANELMDIIHGDLEEQITEFLKDYFYDTAVINGVKVIKDV